MIPHPPSAITNCHFFGKTFFVAAARTAVVGNTVDLAEPSHLVTLHCTISSHHIPLHHTTPYRIPHYITSHHINPDQPSFHETTPYHTTPHHITLRAHTSKPPPTPHHTTSHHLTARHVSQSSKEAQSSFYSKLSCSCASIHPASAIIPTGITSTWYYTTISPFSEPRIPENAISPFPKGSATFREPSRVFSARGHGGPALHP